MLEIFSAWREVLHISEWTGLSLGALAGLAALVYFVHIPFLTAVRIAVLIVTAYFCLLLGDAVGVRDKQRQWDAARAAAAEASKKHDADVAELLERKYRPELEQIEKQSQANKDLADGYEKKMLALLARAPAGNKPPAAHHQSAGASCQLGSLAGRLHVRREPRHFSGG